MGKDSVFFKRLATKSLTMHQEEYGQQIWTRLGGLGWSYGGGVGGVDLGGLVHEYNWGALCEITE